jgi:hypothetical protein
VYQRYANWLLLPNHLGIGRGATSYEIIRSGLFINHNAIITIQLECTLCCTVHTMGKLTMQYFFVLIFSLFQSMRLCIYYVIKPLTFIIERRRNASQQQTPVVTFKLFRIIKSSNDMFIPLRN